MDHSNLLPPSQREPLPTPSAPSLLVCAPRHIEDLSRLLGALTLPPSCPYSAAAEEDDPSATPPQPQPTVAVVVLPTESYALCSSLLSPLPGQSTPLPFLPFSSSSPPPPSLLPLLPPLPTPSVLLLRPPPFPLLPYRHHFNGLLLKIENLFVRLCTINAFIATMGGGAFLCRYLGVATRLAQYQRRVAGLLNDPHLSLHCTINESYNYIHMGRYEEALAVIRTVIRDGKAGGDDKILAVARAARLFCKRARNAAGKFQLGMEHENIKGDELYRLRTGAREL